jgi:hypothetical protein
MQTRLRSPSKDASTDHCPPPRTILGAGLQPHTGPLQEAHTRLHGCALHGAGLLPSTLSHCPGQKGRPSTELALPALPREKRKHGCEVHRTKVQPIITRLARQKRAPRNRASTAHWPAKKQKGRMHGCAVHGAGPLPGIPCHCTKTIKGKKQCHGAAL